MSLERHENAKIWPPRPAGEGTYAAPNVRGLKPPTKFRFSTTNADEFASLIEPVAPNVVPRPLEDDSFDSKVEAMRLPETGFFKARFHNFRVLRPKGHPYLALTVPLDKPIAIVERGTTETFVPGHIHLLHSGDTLNLSTSEPTSMLVTTFNEGIVRSFGKRFEATERFAPEQLVRRVSLATPEGQSLWRHLRFIWSEIARGGAFVRSPVAMREIEFSLMAMLVLAADNRPRALSKSGNVSLSPAHLRRAEEYLEAHVTAPVSMADLARAAGVSARTLLRAFKKHYGLSPMAFLKQRRLEAAQRSLLVAEPGATTVTEVALNHGFTHFGRFAEDYQKAFQEKPSETLRR